MTTLTAALNQATCRVCANVSAWLKRALHSIQFNRQMAANRKVAADLIHLGFHAQKEHDQILQRMNDHTVNEYYKRY